MILLISSPIVETIILNSLCHYVMIQGDVN